MNLAESLSAYIYAHPACCMTSEKQFLCILQPRATHLPYLKEETRNRQQASSECDEERKEKHISLIGTLRGEKGKAQRANCGAVQGGRKEHRTTIAPAFIIHTSTMIRIFKRQGGISVRRLCTAVQSLWVAIQRLRMCIQSLQTEISVCLNVDWNNIKSEGIAS